MTAKELLAMMLGFAAPSMIPSDKPQRASQPTRPWSMWGCPQSKKDDDKPRGFPGAKLARKAMEHKVTGH